MLKQEWLTPTVMAFVRLWQKAGWDWDWEDLPFMADALEDAGYDEPSTLRGLRDSRGCRVGDFASAVLFKRGVVRRLREARPELLVRDDGEVLQSSAGAVKG